MKPNKYDTPLAFWINRGTQVVPSDEACTCADTVCDHCATRWADADTWQPERERQALALAVVKYCDEIARGVVVPADAVGSSYQLRHLLHTLGDYVEQRMRAAAAHANDNNVDALNVIAAASNMLQRATRSELPASDYPPAQRERDARNARFAERNARFAADPIFEAVECPSCGAPIDESHHEDCEL